MEDGWDGQQEVKDVRDGPQRKDGCQFEGAQEQLEIESAKDVYGGHQLAADQEIGCARDVYQRVDAQAYQRKDALVFHQMDT